MNQTEPTITIPVRFLESIDLESFGAFVLESVQFKHERAFGRWLRDLDPTVLAELFAIMSGSEAPPEKPEAPIPKPAAEPKKPRARRAKLEPTDDETAELCSFRLTALQWLRDQGPMGASFMVFESHNGLSEGQAKGLLKRWVDAGLVKKEKVGHGVTYIATPLCDAVLVRSAEESDKSHLLA